MDPYRTGDLVTIRGPATLYLRSRPCEGAYYDRDMQRVEGARRRYWIVLDEIQNLDGDWVEVTDVSGAHGWTNDLRRFTLQQRCDP